MNHLPCIAKAIHELTAPLQKALQAFIIILVPFITNAQAVTGIITDYKGYWKTSASAHNPAKPDDSHNLLAFSFNGKQYSTGVNDELLSSKGENFIHGDFWSLPVGALGSSPNSNTKAGFGALYDRIQNGPGNTPPAYGIAMYLTDGIKGLNIDTCIANLPAGDLTFNLSTIRPTSIGDGVPDILVTQIADPSGAYDRYEFTDENGMRIGNYKDIVFTHISPVATWTADFYEAKVNPLSLLNGFTQTDRPMRLWAADLSEFGITAANYTSVRHFKINLSGQSDVAFVAYNNQSVNFQQVLPVEYSFFKAVSAEGKARLSWQTVSEQMADRFVVERSADGTNFQEIGSVKATNKATETNDYHFIDGAPLSGPSWYRLKQVDQNGSFHYSTIVKMYNAKNSGSTLEVFPNPARHSVYLNHEPSSDGQILLHHSGGMLVRQHHVTKDAVQTKINLTGLTAGTYYITYQNNLNRTSTTIVVH